MTGSGTLADPYVIWDVNDLQNMNLDLAAYYELGTNIDASVTVGWNGGDGFLPVGNVYNAGGAIINNWFTGSFDGKGHSIFNLTINRTTGWIDYWYYVGLFGAIHGGASIKNVKLVNCSITGRNNVGAVVGGSDVGGTVTNCSSTGSVTGVEDVGGVVGMANTLTTEKCHSTCDVIASNGRAGGLTGHCFGDISIDRCYATGTISAANWAAGGLIGETSVVSARVSRCFATGNVSANDSAGGLIGYFSNGKIEDCYATGSVTAITTKAGGLIGEASSGSVDNCYSTGSVSAPANEGGLVGSNIAGATSITDSFWDKDTSGLDISDGGIGRTTADMKQLATFTGAGWDITGSPLVPAGSYPVLSWQFGNSPIWFISMSATPKPSVATLPATEIR